MRPVLTPTVVRPRRHSASHPTPMDLTPFTHTDRTGKRSRGIGEKGQGTPVSGRTSPQTLGMYPQALGLGMYPQTLGMYPQEGIQLQYGGPAALGDPCVSCLPHSSGESDGSFGVGPGGVRGGHVAPLGDCQVSLPDRPPHVEVCPAPETP